jgi:hypothetical protein
MENGAVEPVDGLQLKIEAAVARMPQVRRLYVAADQEQDARVWASGRLDVIGIASASQALDKAFGQQLAALLLQEGSDPSRRQEIAEWFFRFCLLGRGELVDWSPVGAAAKQALKTWPDLTDDQRFELHFAQGVAERHEWNGGSLPVPSAAWLLARPAPLRTHIVAQLVQQVADVGQPSWGEVEYLVNLVRQPIVTDAHPMQLRLEGALARLWAVTGRPVDALKLQEQLARAYFDSLLYSDVSFPLAEWFRLSGAVKDEAAFERAERMRLALLAVGGLGLHGSVYVELARCKALALLRPDCYEVTATVLGDLVHNPRAPQHVRWSAARWALRLASSRGDAATLVSLHAVLKQAAAADDPRQNHSAALNLALVQLDIAVNGEPQSSETIDRLEELEPGLIAHLRRAAGEASATAYVAVNYPY